MCSFVLLKDCSRGKFRNMAFMWKFLYGSGSFGSFVSQADQISGEDVRLKAGTSNTFFTAETFEDRGTRGNFPGDSNQPGPRCIGKLWVQRMTPCI